MGDFRLTRLVRPVLVGAGRWRPRRRCSGGSIGSVAAAVEAALAPASHVKDHLHRHEDEPTAATQATGWGWLHLGQAAYAIGEGIDLAPRTVVPEPGIDAAAITVPVVRVTPPTDRFR